MPEPGRYDLSGGGLACGPSAGLVRAGMLGRLPFTHNGGGQQKSNQAKSSEGNECNHEDRHTMRLCTYSQALVTTAR